MTTTHRRAPTLKLILCGDFGVGKTSLFRRFVNNSFTSDNTRKSTIGLDNYTKPYQDTQDSVHLNLWDTGGLERVASITSSYYKYTEAALLVYSCDNLSSFHSCSQHLIEILSYSESCKVFLVGNKSDLREEVDEREVEEFCEQCSPTITSTYKVSCKTGVGVEEMFQSIASTLIAANKSKFELRALEEEGFRLEEEVEETERRSNCC